MWWGLESWPPFSYSNFWWCRNLHFQKPPSSPKFGAPLGVPRLLVLSIVPKYRQQLLFFFYNKRRDITLRIDNNLLIYFCIMSIICCFNFLLHLLLHHKNLHRSSRWPLKLLLALLRLGWYLLPAFPYLLKLLGCQVHMPQRAFQANTEDLSERVYPTGE